MFNLSGIIFSRQNAISHLCTMIDVLEEKCKDSSDVMISIRSDDNNIYLDLSFNNAYCSVVTLTFEQSSNLPF